MILEKKLYLSTFYMILRPQNTFTHFIHPLPSQNSGSIPASSTFLIVFK